MEPALEARGLRLTNPIVDTAELAAVVLRRGGRTVRRPICLTRLASALNLPVHRPHQADGDALTTAQAFLALVAHLDAVSPQTVGSLQRHGTRSRHLAAPAALRGVLARLSRG